MEIQKSSQGKETSSFKREGEPPELQKFDLGQLGFVAGDTVVKNIN